jgi:hypothetical protein
MIRISELTGFGTAQPSISIAPFSKLQHPNSFFLRSFIDDHQERSECVVANPEVDMV